MKEYKRKRNGGELIRVLGDEGSTSMEYVLNPGAGQARQEEQQQLEQQTQMLRSSLPEVRDDALAMQQSPNQENRDAEQHTFLPRLIALIALVLLIAGVIIYHSTK